MNPEKQRIAIAKACGYEFGLYGGVEQWFNLRLGEGQSAIVGPTDCYLPNYLHDLNTMHEAEKLIMDESSITYFEHLNRISCPWHATAAQRAEAFLKTIGKWKE